MVAEVRYSPAVMALIESPEEMVYAKDLSPIVGMHPSVIVHQAKTGKWKLCRYVVTESGKRVKFFRVDFLKKGGWIS